MSSTIEQSLTNLNSLPPSPRLGAVGSGSLSESFSLSGLSSPVSSIEQSLVNLNSLPPSPRLAPADSSFDSSKSLKSFDSSKSLESLSYLATRIDKTMVRRLDESTHRDHSKIKLIAFYLLLIML